MKDAPIQPRDDSIIHFIHAYLRDEEALLDYFSRLERPLNARILTTQVLSPDDEIINFLSITAYNDALLQRIVALTPQADIDLALMDNVASDASETTLRLFDLGQVPMAVPAFVYLICQAHDRAVEGIRQVFRKVGTDTLNQLMLHTYMRMGYLTYVLNTTDDALLAIVLDKLYPETIDRAFEEPSTIESVLFALMHTVSTPNAEAFLRKMSDKSRRMLMTSYPAALILFTITTQCGMKNRACLLLNHVPTDTLNDIALSAKHPHDRALKNIWIISVIYGFSQDMMNAIFSRLTQKTIARLVLPDTIVRLTTMIRDRGREFLGLMPDFHVASAKSLIYSLGYISPAILYEGIISKNGNNYSINKSILYSTALYNTILNKLFLASYRFILDAHCSYQLNTKNLMLYLAQNPEITLETAGHLPPVILSNSANEGVVKYKVRLAKAGDRLYQSVTILLASYLYLLEHTACYGVLAYEILDYLIENDVIRSRIKFEIFKLKELKPLTTNVIQNLPFYNGNQAQKKREAVCQLTSSWGNSHIRKPFHLWQVKSSNQQLQEEAKHYGYVCNNLSGDGNCFYHVIAHQLSVIGLGHVARDAKILREKTLTYIASHLEEYADFLDQHEGDILTFMIANEKPHGWVDDVIIRAVSRAFNLTIVCVRSDKTPPTICKRHDAVGTVTLGYEVGRHYQSLVENAKLPKLKDLEALVDAAAYDEGVDKNPSHCHSKRAPSS